MLRNKMGVRSTREMDVIEFDALLTAQGRWLHRVTSETRFTAELICQMHRDWLGSIYEWAGRYRMVNLAKGTFRWPPYHLIPSSMETLTQGLLTECTPCRPGPVEVVADRIARVHAELLFIHPFREGNGRLARWFADLMAMQANYPVPVYGFTGRGAKARKDQYLKGVILGYGQDYAALTDFFREAIEAALREER